MNVSHESRFRHRTISSTEMKKSYNLDAAYGILSEKEATNNAYALTHEILQYCKTKG